MSFHQGSSKMIIDDFQKIHALATDGSFDAIAEMITIVVIRDTKMINGPIWLKIKSELIEWLQAVGGILNVYNKTEGQRIVCTVIETSIWALEHTSEG